MKFKNAALSLRLKFRAKQIERNNGFDNPKLELMLELGLWLRLTQKMGTVLKF